jgi:hypothetical protein
MILYFLTIAVLHAVSRRYVKAIVFQESQKLMLELYRALTSFRSTLSGSKCCLPQIPQRNAVLIDEPPLPMIVGASSHGYHFPAERFSSSEVETDLIIESIEMAATRKQKIMQALCVSIKHIMVIISWLRALLY